MNKESRRIIGFDVARAFSIIWIVAVYHVLPSAHLPLVGPVKTITYSSLGIFTFLSAFLLASRYDFRKVGAIGQFYRKRVLRFYPLFFLSSIILYAIGYNPLFTTIKGLLGISPFWKPHPTTMWYCAMLISLYLITPFWATGSYREKMIKFLATMAAICGIQLAFHSVVPRTFCYFPVYFGGIIISQYKYQGFLNLLRSSRFLLYSCLLFLMILGIQLKYNSQWIIISNSAIGIMAFLSLYMFIGNMVGKAESERYGKAVAMLSYSSMCMYLFHREVHCALIWFYSPSSPLIMVLYLGIIGLLITIPLSYCIQRLYDLSINNFTNGILHNERNSCVS